MVYPESDNGVGGPADGPQCDVDNCGLGDADLSALGIGLLQEKKNIKRRKRGKSSWKFYARTVFIYSFIYLVLFKDLVKK